MGTKPNWKLTIIMRFLVLLTGLLQVQISWADCVARPEILFSLKVGACQAVNIGNSALSPSFTEGGVKGVLLSGRIVSSKLVWHNTDARGLAPRESFEVDSYQTVFVPGESDEVCKMEVGEDRWMITSRPCCDIVPARGLCVVPWSMEIATENISEQNWFPVESDSLQ